MGDDEAPITGCIPESPGDLVRKTYSQSLAQTYLIKVSGNLSRDRPPKPSDQHLRPLSAVHFCSDSMLYPPFKALSWEVITILILLKISFLISLTFPLLQANHVFVSPRPGDTVMIFISLRKKYQIYFAIFMLGISAFSPHLQLAPLPLSSSSPFCIPFQAFRFASLPLRDASDFCQMHFPLVFVRFILSLAKSSF